MRNSQFDWDAIRCLYEAGESPAHIEQREGMPSRQAIHQRIHKEGWQPLNQVDPRFEMLEFEGLTPEQQIVVQNVAEGMPQKYAAHIAGVHEKTVSHWKAEHPTFSTVMKAAVAWKARRRLGKIENAQDWRAQMALLERDRDLRDDFKPPAQQVGGQIIGHTFNVLNHFSTGIAREEPEPRVIEHEE